jgi:hypothetical protein
MQRMAAAAGSKALEVFDLLGQLDALMYAILQVSANVLDFTGSKATCLSNFDSLGDSGLLISGAGKSAAIHCCAGC